MKSPAAVLCLGSIVAATMLAAVFEQAPVPEPAPRYDPAAVIDAMVVVTDIRETPGNGSLSGLHLMVKKGSETLDVYLGPMNYLKQFELRFAKGDRIQVAGSKVRYGNGYVVLAREVRKEDTTLYIRDRKGEPNWGAHKSAT